MLPVLYLMEPVYRIRFGTIYTQRFGHLAQNADTFIRKFQRDGFPPRTRYFFFGENPCNRQLLDMWMRCAPPGVHFIDSRWATRVAFALRIIFYKTRFWERQSISGTEYRLYHETSPVLTFSEEEEARGKKNLKEMGIGEDEWFVCFHARDDAFLKQWRPDLKDHWDKVDFRNVNIELFMEAAEFITAKGGVAIRYGAIVDAPLPETGNPRIIDYATKFRSDFMDIYLAAKCRFFLGSSSGADSVSLIFNRPLVCANHFPYNFTRIHPDSILIPRFVSEPDKQQPVGYWRALEDGYYVAPKVISSMHPNMHLYRMLDVEPEDVLNGCRDMLDILENRTPNEARLRYQKIYGEKYLSQHPDYELGGKVSPRFAEKYAHLIDSEATGPAATRNQIPETDRHQTDFKQRSNKRKFSI